MRYSDHSYQSFCTFLNNKKKPNTLLAIKSSMRMVANIGIEPTRGESPTVINAPDCIKDTPSPFPHCPHLPYSLKDTISDLLLRNIGMVVEPLHLESGFLSCSFGVLFVLVDTPPPLLILYSIWSNKDIVLVNEPCLQATITRNVQRAFSSITPRCPNQNSIHAERNTQNFKKTYRRLFVPPSMFGKLIVPVTDCTLAFISPAIV